MVTVLLRWSGFGLDSADGPLVEADGDLVATDADGNAPALSLGRIMSMTTMRVNAQTPLSPRNVRRQVAADLTLKLRFLGYRSGPGIVRRQGFTGGHSQPASEIISASSRTDCGTLWDYRRRPSKRPPRPAGRAPTSGTRLRGVGRVGS